ncbi:dTDP-4-dehydrorhamnose 3,5-epimerase [Sneathiella sp. P13V-1]|uniref:dTDP-4-dehydrorhamnose 3,5-epimerase n=1 Tax=Sneathiella sp. P13V-1 TaxID=2697366 RepID=UPI00187B7F87|nr:dTDP-4-dehydrorhamnose 3,5-epimerase [Sneathiella sp. P13V-1]MBE7637999.1 dTDP-4-dehydrorhamnose 3,5-epimerase [Sneathiella sp. P13V-1]
MDIETTAIKDVIVVTPRRFGDSRGFFSEVWNEVNLQSAGITDQFVQDNHAFSAEKGTIRGLHYQLSPNAQGKLVRVTRGAVLDVAADIRKGSPTFGQHVAVELSADNWKQLWVPKGFAHGYCTLTENVEFLYKVSGKYSPEDEAGIIWNDPDLAIDWKVDPSSVHLSDKDKILPRLKDQNKLFEYGEIA